MASVNIDDLELAVEFVSTGDSADHAAYISIVSGTVYWEGVFTGAEPLPNDIEDRDKYLAIPTKAELGLGKSVPLSFAPKYLAEDYDNVRAIFSRSGAYRRFNSTLESRQLMEQWYTFENEAQRSAL